MSGKIWLGRAVHVSTSQGEGVKYPIVIEPTEEAARKLALALGRLRQTYSMGLLPEVEEIYQALNYVLVGDPASTQLHRQMEASKGMEPSGG